MSDLDSVFADLDTATRADAMSLAVDADLQVELTTAAGASSTAWVTGHGQQIRVAVQRPGMLLAAVDRADVGRSADLLAAAGFTVSVHGPDGPLATLGAATFSRFGRAVTGSARVAPVPGAVLRLVWASTPVRMAAAAIPVASAVLATIRSLRGRTAPHRPRRR